MEVGTTTEVLLATKNTHKVEEFRRLFAPFGIDLTALPAHVPNSPESGTSFAANALQKAEFYSQYGDGWVLADDSGICVDALNGAPGIHSARFAGPDSTDALLRTTLLQRLKGVPTADRQAEMVCVLALWRRGGPAGIVARGVIRGRIHTDERGAAGFGYDPLFYLPDLGYTFAELTPQGKDAISHRAHAVQSLLQVWRWGLPQG